MEVSAFDTLPIGARLTRDLRSDHAGEVGAVEIYRGMLAVARSSELLGTDQISDAQELRERAFHVRSLRSRERISCASPTLATGATGACRAIRPAAARRCGGFE